jgi:hypothetical protein
MKQYTDCADLTDGADPIDIGFVQCVATGGGPETDLPGFENLAGLCINDIVCTILHI